MQGYSRIGLYQPHLKAKKIEIKSKEKKIDFVNMDEMENKYCATFSDDKPEAKRYMKIYRELAGDYELLKKAKKRKMIE